MSLALAVAAVRTRLCFAISRVKWPSPRPLQPRGFPADTFAREDARRDVTARAGAPILRARLLPSTILPPS